MPQRLYAGSEKVARLIGMTGAWMVAADVLDGSSLCPGHHIVVGAPVDEDFRHAVFKRRHVDPRFARRSSDGVAYHSDRYLQAVS